MKILVTGKNGQVGCELQRSLASIGDVIAVGTAECDLSNLTAIVSLVKQIEPDLIINAAAYTAVDRAEVEYEAAYAINAMAPKVLAEQASLLDIPMVHYSTDYVFDGTKNEPYTENDIPNPKSVYGKSKWEGEKNISSVSPKHVILRTSWVFSQHRTNFLKTILQLAQEKEQLNIIADQFGAPTSAVLLADVTAEIVRQFFQTDFTNHSLYGLFNLVSTGETTWFEYAQKVLELAHFTGVNTKLKPSRIKPIATVEYPLPAQRPANSRLKTDKICKTFGIELPTWESEVERIFKKINR